MHDIGKPVDHEVEGTHHQISAELAKKYGESPKMINAIYLIMKVLMNLRVLKLLL
jgi:putative nucleotidyltransferase with HDIG domain